MTQVLGFGGPRYMWLRALQAVAFRLSDVGLSVEDLTLERSAYFIAPVQLGFGSFPWLSISSTGLRFCSVISQQV